jgi:hypothetical protein
MSSISEHELYPTVSELARPPNFAAVTTLLPSGLFLTWPM